MLIIMTLEILCWQIFLWQNKESYFLARFYLQEPFAMPLLGSLTAFKKPAIANHHHDCWMPSMIEGPFSKSAAVAPKPTPKTAPRIVHSKICLEDVILPPSELVRFNAMFLLTHRRFINGAQKCNMKDKEIVAELTRALMRHLALWAVGLNGTGSS
jgi:hypothetical protein